MLNSKNENKRNPTIKTTLVTFDFMGFTHNSLVQQHNALQSLSVLKRFVNFGLNTSSAIIRYSMIITSHAIPYTQIIRRT